MVEFGLFRHPDSNGQEITTQVDSGGNQLQKNPVRTNIIVEEGINRVSKIHTYIDVIGLSVN